MNNPQGNSLVHFEKIVSFCEKYMDDLAPIPIIGSEYLPKMKQLLAQTYQDDSVSWQNNTGTTETKTKARERLVKHIDVAVAALLSYADDQEDVVLAAMLDYPISAINGFSQGRLIQLAHYVLKKLELPDLQQQLETNHNYPKGETALLATATEDFLLLLTAPQEAIAVSKIAGNKVDKYLQEMQTILEKLRRKMRTFRQTNPTFFTIFEAYDTIINHDGGKKSVGNHVLEGFLKEGEQKKINNLVFEPDTAIQLENIGNTTIGLQLYLKGNPLGQLVLLPANDTLNTTLGEIAENADALYLENTSFLTIGKWRLKW